MFDASGLLVPPGIVDLHGDAFKIARQRHRVRSAILSFSVPFVITRSGSSVKNRLLKTARPSDIIDNRRALRPHTKLTTRPN